MAILRSLFRVAGGAVEGIEINCQGTFDIQAGSSIDVTGKSTKTTGTAANNSSGGSYGGSGGSSNGAAAAVYGDSTAALAGSKGSDTGTGYLTGGNGGGRIKIVSNILNVNGTIQANGKGGNFPTVSAYGGGGGSGGGVSISANTLTVNNYISAAGGGGGGSKFNTYIPQTGGDGLNGTGGTGGTSGQNAGGVGGAPGLAGNGGSGIGGVGGSGGLSAGGAGGGITSLNYKGGGGGGAGRISIQYGTLNGDFQKIVGQSAAIQETDSTITYSGTWSSVTGGGYGTNVLKTSSTTNDYYQVNFNSTGVYLYGTQFVYGGQAAVYLDNVYQQDIDFNGGTFDAGLADCLAGPEYYGYTTGQQCYDAFNIPSNQVNMYTKTGLSNGAHTLKVIVKGTHSANSDGYQVNIDYYTTPAVTVNNGYLDGLNANGNVSAGKIGPYGYYNRVTPYYTTALIGGANTASNKVGIRAGLTKKVKWSNIQIYGSIPSGTAVQFMARFNDTVGTGTFYKPTNKTLADTWSDAASLPAGTYTSSSPGTIDISSQGWYSKNIELYIYFTGDGTATPQIDDIVLNYDYLNTPTAPKQFNGSNQINQSGYTNTGTVVLKSSIQPKPDTTSLTPEIEVVSYLKGSDPGTPTFTGTPTTAGVTISGITYNSTDCGVTNTYNDCTNTLTDKQIATVILATATGHAVDGYVYYWRVRMTDGKGRVSDWSDSNNVASDKYGIFSVDQTPPTIASISMVTANPTNSTAITVHVNNATDSGSKLSTLSLSTDGGSTWADKTPGSGFIGQTSYTGNISGTLASGDGTDTILVKVADIAGNPSTNAQTTVLLDQNPPNPAPTLTCTGFTSGTWSNNGAATTCTINDTAGPSPRTAVAYSTNNGSTWTDNTNNLSFSFTPAEGTTNVIMRLSDTGGTTNSNTFAIQKDISVPAQPTLTCTIYSNNTWTNSTSASNCSINSPSGAGPSPITTAYSTDNGAHWNDNAGSLGFSFTPPNDGTFNILMRISDTGGGPTVSTAWNIERDTQAPNPAPILACAGFTSGTWSSNGAATNCTITDTSGPSPRTTTAYSTDNGSTWTDNSGGLSFSFTPAEGTTNVIMRISDTGGGPTNSNTFVIKKDTSVPTASTLSCTGFTSNTWVSNSGATTCTETDTSGPSPKVTAYSTDNGSTWTDNSGGLSFSFTPAEGTTNVIMRISDTGGGPTNSNTFVIKKDTTAPMATISAAVQSGSTIGLTVTTADAQSGIQDINIQYKEVNMSVTGNSCSPGDFTAAVWQNIGTGAWGDVGITTFAGTSGKAYKFQIQAKNNAGVVGSGATDPGTQDSFYGDPAYVTLDTTPPMATISYATGFKNVNTVNLTIVQADSQSCIASGDLEFAEADASNGTPNFTTPTWQYVDSTNKNYTAGTTQWNTAWKDTSTLTFTGRSGYAYMFRYSAKNNAGLAGAGTAEPGTLNAYSSPGNWVAFDTNAPDTPTISVTQSHLFSGVNYVNNLSGHIYNLMLRESDFGGSNVAGFQLSDDGVAWGTTQNILSSDPSLSYNGTDKKYYYVNSATTWQIPDVEGDYTKYVKFEDGVGNWSSSASVTIRYDKTAPFAVVLSAPDDNSWTNQAQVTFRWLQNFNNIGNNTVDHYDLQIDGTWVATGIADGVNPSYTYTFPAGNQGLHTWFVRTYDGALNYTDSASRTIGFDTLTPTQIASPGFHFAASRNLSNKITLSWSAYSDTGSPVAGYTIERIKYNCVTGLTTDQTLTADWSSSAFCANSQYYSYPIDPTTTSKDLAARVTNPSDPNYTTQQNDQSLIDSSTNYQFKIKVTDLAGNVSVWMLTDLGRTDDVVAPSPSSSNVQAVACDGTTNTILTAAQAQALGVPNIAKCSNYLNKGYEVALSWKGTSDAGVGLIGYKIYRKAETDSSNRADFALVGYLTAGTPGAPVQTSWYDNDTNSAGAYSETLRGVLTQIKPLSSAGYIKGDGTMVNGATDLRLNDYVSYFYRVTAIDANGNESDVITTTSTVPAVVTSVNEAGAQTPDITAPLAPSAPDASGIGLDGQQVPKQEVDISWSPASDGRTVGRVPTGQGIGISYYNLSYASSGTVPAADPSLLNYQALGGNIAYNDSTIFSTVTNRYTYPQIQLPDNTYYYYRITATDSAAHASTFAVAQAKTGNSDLPNTSSFVQALAVKGDPNTNIDVGHKINVGFVGGFIKNAPNTITGYQVYRSTTNTSSGTPGVCNTGESRDDCWIRINNAGSPIWTASGLSVPHDTYDPGDLACATHVLPFGLGTVHLRCFTDTVPQDATTYYYKVRTVGVNLSISSGNVYSTLSAAANDTVPDATAPSLPSGVTIRDIHGDGVAFLRNIISWQRITNPSRNGTNDFKEYRIYRSTSPLSINFQQICQDPIQKVYVLKNSCDTSYPNPLYSADQNTAMGNNYFIDPIGADPIVANQIYYYYVTAVDNADTFKYQGTNTVINADTNGNPYPPNESKPQRDITTGQITNAVSLNPSTTQPSIIAQSNGLKSNLLNVGVASATVHWTTDQVSDSMVMFRKAGTQDTYRQIGNGDSSRGLGMTTDHNVSLFGLLPGTAYEYVIVSRNFLSNPVTAEGSNVQQLTTSGFNISGIATDSTTTTAIVTWQTNIQADGNYVEFQMQRQPGDDALGGTIGQDMSVVLDPTTQQLRTNLSQTDINTYLLGHKVIIGGLKSARTYSFKIRSVSTDGFVTYSNLQTFNTKSFDTSQFSLAPTSSNVADRNITSTTAQIVWNTSMPTTSWIEYGTATGTYSISSGDNSLNTIHVVNLTGLVPGTKYFYRARVKDANDIEYTSPEYSFTAVIKPKISNLQVTNVTPYSVTLAWDTNVDTETVLNWGTSTNYGEKRGTGGTSQVHQVTIDNLTDNTEYHYQIVAHDGAGNEVVGSDGVVRTPLDTEGPKITGVKTDIMPLGDSDTTAQVIISWTTNKPSTTQVQYDEGIMGGRYTKSSTEDVSLNNSHTVIIKGLNVGATYHYRIVTKDKRGNTTISNDYTFVTPTKEQSIWTLIVNSLQQTFAWTKNLGKLFKR